jgi:hypothetical protein
MKGLSKDSRLSRLVLEPAKLTSQVKVRSFIAWTIVIDLFNKIDLKYTELEFYKYS